MDGLCADADVAASDWEHRREVLQRLLIRPMWTYHAQQAKKLAAIEARRQQTKDASRDDKDTATR
jgi:hypothetical protein